MQTQIQKQKQIQTRTQTRIQNADTDANTDTDTDEDEDEEMSFEPKTKVDLAPPRDDIISLEHLAKCDGRHEGFPTYVVIKVSRFAYVGHQSHTPHDRYTGQTIYAS